MRQQEAVMRQESGEKILLPEIFHIFLGKAHVLHELYHLLQSRKDGKAALVRHAEPDIPRFEVLRGAPEPPAVPFKVLYCVFPVLRYDRGQVFFLQRNFLRGQAGAER